MNSVHINQLCFICVLCVISVQHVFAEEMALHPVQSAPSSLALITPLYCYAALPLETPLRITLVRLSVRLCRAALP